MSDKATRLLAAAIAVAEYPPEKHNASRTFSAQVPWTRIEELRAALDDIAINWRKP